jgi:hypothetical protein
MRKPLVVLEFAAMGLIAATSAAPADPLPEIPRDLVEEGSDEGTTRSARRCKHGPLHPAASKGKAPYVRAFAALITGCCLGSLSGRTIIPA